MPACGHVPAYWHGLPVWSAQPPPQRTSQGAAEPDAAHQGARAPDGVRVGTEHALCQAIIRAPQQVAVLLVPYWCMTMPGSTGCSRALATG